LKLGQFSITFFHAKEGTLFVEGVVLEPGKFHPATAAQPLPELQLSADHDLNTVLLDDDPSKEGSE